MGAENNNVVLATAWNDEWVVHITAEQPIDLQGLFAVVPALTNNRNSHKAKEETWIS